MKRRRRGRLKGKDVPASAFVPTKISCLREKKNQLLKAARFPKTTCIDRVVFCHDGRLFIKATCDSKGQAMSYADRVKPLVKVLEKVL
jgi:hypothetical protein